MFKDYSEEVQKVLSDLTAEAEEGHKSALEVSAILSKVEKIAKELRKEIEVHAINEAYKYDTKEDVVKGGCKIELASRTNYSYKHDETWSEFKQNLKDREALMKQAMKSEIWDENGEQVPAPETSQTTYLKFKVL